MQELKRNLNDNLADNLLARLFHIELKDLIREVLPIIAQLPTPSLKPHNLEHYNSRLFVELRDYLLDREPDKRNRKIIETVANAVILLYDSDEAWQSVIDEGLRVLQSYEFKYETIRPSWWKVEGENTWERWSRDKDCGSLN